MLIYPAARALLRTPARRVLLFPAQLRPTSVVQIVRTVCSEKGGGWKEGEGEVEGRVFGPRTETDCESARAALAAAKAAAFNMDGTASVSVAVASKVSHEGLPVDSTSDPLDEEIGENLHPHVKGEPDVSGKSSRIDRRVWPIALSSGLMGISVGVVQPVLPMLATTLSISTAQFGQVVAIVGLSRLFCTIPTSILADVFGRKPLLVYGAATAAIAMGGLSAAASFNQLLFWRMIGGVAGAGQTTGAHLYLADISKPGNRSRTIAPVVAAWGMGFAAGPAVGGLLAEALGPQLPFLGTGLVIGGVAVVNHHMLPETHRRTLAANKHDRDTLAVLAKKYRRLLHNPAIKETSLLAGVFWFLQAGNLLCLLPLILVQQFAFTAGGVGAVYAGFALTSALLSHPIAYISDHVSRRSCIVPGALLVSASVGLLPIAAAHGSLPLLYASLGGWAAGSAAVGTSPTALVADAVNEKERASALALLRTSQDLGGLLGPLLLAAVAQSYGFQIPMTTAACALSAVAIRFGFKVKL